MKNLINAFILLLSMSLFSSLSCCDNSPAGRILQCAFVTESRELEKMVGYVIGYAWMDAPDYDVAGQDMAAVFQVVPLSKNKDIVVTPDQTGLDLDVTIHIQSQGLPYGYVKYGGLIDLNFNDPAHCKWDKQGRIYCPFEC